MKKIKLALVLLIAINLIGCGRTVVKPTPELPRIDIELPEPLKLDSIKWVVITNDNYEEVIKLSENKKGLVFLVALDEEGYKKLSLNHTKVLRYIREQKSVIAAYRKYYETKISK